MPAVSLEISPEFIPKVQFLFEPWRYKVMYGGRGGVKSWSAARALLILGLSGKERILCARELQKSLDESVHKLLADQISLLQMNYLYEVQQAHIVGRGSAQGTLFSFEGLRHNVAKVKSYEGLTRCWVEEAVKLSKTSFNVLDPTLRVQGSEIWLTYNPELDEDFVHQFFVVQQCPPNAKVCKLTYHDNPWLSATTRELIQHMKETDYDEYLHVYEGHTRQQLEGAIFAEELREALAAGRITKVPYDRSLPVNCYLDLGRSDHTSIWFEQRVGFEHHLIDFYQNRLKHIDHYLKVMQQRGYFYGIIWLPHDGKAKVLGTKMSIEEQVRAAGFTVKIVPKLAITDRINAARTVFPVCYFDEQRCGPEGLRSLKHYQYEVSEGGRFSLNPLHNWASDAADAFCYFGVASKQRVKSAPCQLELPQSTKSGTLGELFTGALDFGVNKANGWLGR